MKKRFFCWKRVLPWQAVLIGSLILLTSGCSLLPMRSPGQQEEITPENSNVTGRLMVAASVASIPELTGEEALVKLTVSKDGQHHTQDIPVIDSQATATVGDLLPGVWQVALSVCDETNQPIYQAEGDVTILPNGTATLELLLRPLPGTLVVFVDPKCHPQFQGAQQGRLYINPGGYTTMTKEEDGTLSASKALPAGSYDYSIALFGATFYVKDRIYESHWDTIDILPGQTTNLHWDPLTGDCLVIGNVDNPPNTPEHVQLNLTEEGLQITWSPVFDSEDDLESYRIYMRQDPLDKFGLVVETDAHTLSYLHPKKQLRAGRTIEVVLTAVDQGGQESKRSQIVNLVYNPS